MSIANPKSVEIYRARNLPEALVIRVTLEEMGIGVQIDGELLQGVVGELPMGWVTAPRIMVEESRSREARQVIDRVIAQNHLRQSSVAVDDATQCLSCGHEIGPEEVNCTVCGWSFLGDEVTEQF